MQCFVYIFTLAFGFLLWFLYIENVTLPVNVCTIAIVVGGSSVVMPTQSLKKNAPKKKKAYLM